MTRVKDQLNPDNEGVFFEEDDTLLRHIEMEAAEAEYYSLFESELPDDTIEGTAGTEEGPF